MHGCYNMVMPPGQPLPGLGCMARLQHLELSECHGLQDLQVSDLPSRTHGCRSTMPAQRRLQQDRWARLWRWWGLHSWQQCKCGALPLIRKCMHMDTGTRVDQWHGHLTEGLSCTPLVPPCADPIESAGKLLTSKLSVQQALQLRQPSQPGVTSLSPAGVGGPHSADLPGCVGVPRSHRQGAGSSGQPDPAAAPQAAAAQVRESQ